MKPLFVLLLIAPLIACSDREPPTDCQLAACFEGEPPTDCQKVAQLIVFESDKFVEMDDEERERRMVERQELLDSMTRHEVALTDSIWLDRGDERLPYFEVYGMCRKVVEGNYQSN